MNEEIKTAGNKDGYVPIYKKELAKMLRQARGDMSMADFAAKCNVSPTTFSRIANGNIEKPLGKDLISRIVQNADPKFGITYDKLMYANGYVKEYDAYEKDPEDYFKEKKETVEYLAIRKRMTENSKNIIMRGYLDQGMGIMIVQENDPIAKDNRVLESGRFYVNGFIDLTLRVQGYEPLFMNYSINVFPEKSLYSTESAEYQKVVKDVARFTFEKYKEIFLRDVWEPEAFENTLYSIVVNDINIFNGLLEKLEGIKVNNYFSLVLVDTDDMKVLDEQFLPRHDGKELRSLIL